ncbi:hypothetical protein DXC87_02075 [Blautia obeum]|jgi:hypothetical protein|uniref:hypothetical protein n=1 Tax=Blautia obeum TaxID=40520 RepID=UPI000E443FE3|nr:hypothetical protein [Blautia obeum]RGK95226.1 hypothetical protein DXC87_02075 [Blautia obeum]
MAKFNEYPAKTTPKDADKFMLYSAEDAANKLIDYDKLADAVLNKLTSKTFGLDAGTMTLPAALNQLNSKTPSKYVTSLESYMRNAPEGVSFCDCQAADDNPFKGNMTICMTFVNSDHN